MLTHSSVLDESNSPHRTPSPHSSVLIHNTVTLITACSTIHQYRINPTALVLHRLLTHHYLYKHSDTHYCMRVQYSSVLDEDNGPHRTLSSLISTHTQHTDPYYCSSLHSSVLDELNDPHCIPSPRSSVFLHSIAPLITACTLADSSVFGVQPNTIHITVHLSSLVGAAKHSECTLVCEPVHSLSRGDPVWLTGHYIKIQELTNQR